MEYLIDMNGMVVQTWPVNHSQYAEILPNGNLMADNVGTGLEEVTPKGEVVWSWARELYHHDFHRVENDEIVALVRREEPVRPGVFEEGLEPDVMQTDIIVRIDRADDILWEFSFGEHALEIGACTGQGMPLRYGVLEEDGSVSPKRAPADWAHTNTIEVLPDTPIGRKDERFRAGNLLFSFRALDTIGVVDPDKDAIVWAWGPGTLDGQHQPTMTDAGTILIFDNGTARGYSAAVEIDPSTEEEVWRYEDREGFFSPYRAGVQRLPNGNTLIAESDAGRIFEVTPEKEIVWDYYNPFLSQPSGSQGLHVYRATRYTDEQVAPVFAARADERVTAVGRADLSRVERYNDAVEFYREGLNG